MQVTRTKCAPRGSLPGPNATHAATRRTEVGAHTHSPLDVYSQKSPNGEQETVLFLHAENTDNSARENSSRHTGPSLTLHERKSPGRVHTGWTTHPHSPATHLLSLWVAARLTSRTCISSCRRCTPYLALSGASLNHVTCMYESHHVHVASIHPRPTKDRG